MGFKAKAGQHVPEPLSIFGRMQPFNRFMLRREEHVRHGFMLWPDSQTGMEQHNIHQKDFWVPVGQR